MAFMGEESWKSGLTGFQLTKISDLETQLAKLKKERGEKSMQVEILQQTIEKQKRKVSFLLLVQSQLLFLRTCVLPHISTDCVARIFSLTPMLRPGIELTLVQLSLF